MSRKSLLPWLLRFLFVIALILSGRYGLSWGGVVVLAVIFGALLPSKRGAFREAFLIAFLTWMTMAFAQDVGTGFRLSERISAVFHLPFSMLGLILTGVAPGLIAGAAAASGQVLRHLFAQIRSNETRTGSI